MSTTTNEAPAVTAVAITNRLPAQLVVLSSEVVTKRDNLTFRAQAVRIADEASLAEAEAVFVALDGFVKEVHEGRMTLTRQLDALKAEIMDAEQTAVGTLSDHKKAVGKAISDFRAELLRIADEKARKVKEAAEAEAKRLREEAKENAKREEERIAAEQKTAAEEAALFGDGAPAPAPRPVPVVPVLSVPVVAPAALPAAPALPKSAVRTQTRQRLIIDDAGKLIAEACKTGGALFGRPVVTLDEKAIDDLLRAGCAVPHAHLESYEIIGSAGRRG
jgi:hypothetical protein